MSIACVVRENDVVLAKNPEGKLFYVCGEYDDWGGESGNPRDWGEPGEPGQFYSWNNKYSIGDKKVFRDMEEYLLEVIQDIYPWRKEDYPVLLELIIGCSDYVIRSKDEVDLTYAETDDNGNEYPYYLCDFDHEGKMYPEYGLSSKDLKENTTDDDEYSLYRALNHLSAQELLECVRYIPDYAFKMIYIYDHSGISLSTSPFWDPWDSGVIGIFGCTKEGCMKSWLKDSKDFKEENWKDSFFNYVENHIKILNHIYAGEDYWFCQCPVETLETLVKELEEKSPNDIKDVLRNAVKHEHTDSCCGFLGDYEEALENYLESMNLEFVDVVED